MRPKLAFTCGRCGKPKGNPLTHVCVTRLDKPRSRGRARLVPKLSVTVRCSSCGKRTRNPLTHVCAPKSDFKKRVTAQARAAATAEKRKRAAETRAKETAARRARRAREEAARKTRRQRDNDARKARRTKAAKPSPAKRTHPRPSACRDADCERPVCLAYRDGFEDGAHSAGEQS